MTAPTIGTGRAVEVLHDRGPVIPVDVNRWTGGSGYLIGGRLVLTAAHTVDYRQDLGDNARLLVRTIKGTEFAVQVVLVSDESSQVDLALLEISDPRFDEHLPPVSFARVNRNSPAPVSGCWAVGFPWFGEAGPVLLEGSRRETWHVRGDILPGGKLRSGLLSVQVTSTPQPLSAPVGGSEWEGMSGAVVFASDSPDSDRAIGVVSTHHRPEGESRGSRR
jgi:Trypsin-like peptidase domain